MGDLKSFQGVEEFITWLRKECRTPYRTGTLGHQKYITAVWEPSGLRIDFGTKGVNKTMTEGEIKIIYQRYVDLGPNRLKTGQYESDVFKTAPERIGTPYVPALIRDFEMELHVAGRI